MFPSFWSDDLELCIFWEMPESGIWGHLFHSGINASLEPLPLSQWLSRLNIKQLEGRSLFEQTARERKALIQGLLKRDCDTLPMRVICLTPSTPMAGSVGIEFQLGNPSWMYKCTYEFELKYHATNPAVLNHRFHLAGLVLLDLAAPLSLIKRQMLKLPHTSMQLGYTT